MIIFNHFLISQIEDLLNNYKRTYQLQSTRNISRKHTNNSQILLVTK